MQMKFIGCAAGNFKPGRPFDFTAEAIVVHIAVGSLRSVDSQFNDSNSKVSAHYCVGKTGEIHQYVHETDTAFHTGTVVNPSWPLLKPKVNPNFYTIGIEHEGLPDDVWPDPQIATSAALIGEIAQRWKIPLDPLHVIRHHQIRASKTCPGNFMTIENLLSRVPAPPRAPSPRLLRTTVNLKVRAGKASVKAPAIRTVPANTTISASGVETGDDVNGNPNWYADGMGNFFWAGGTSEPQPA